MKRRSLRSELLRVVLATASAVLVAGIAMLTWDLSVTRYAWIADLSNEASMLAIATGPALAFDDHRVAQQYLEALRARPQILVAALYDSNGKLYAAYRPSKEHAAPATVPAATEAKIAVNRVQLVRPIVRGAETLGYLYLLARYDIAGRIYAYLGIFGLVLCLSLAVAYLFSRRLQRSITEPLEAISTVAREIVDRRDYSLRVKETAQAEFGFVVDALNNMLQEVQEAARAQESANRLLQDEVHTRQAAEAALSAADRRKDEFLATLAHELRNPLAPIRQGIRILERRDTDAAQAQWAREVISRQVRRMALMLDDLLDVSRITRGRLELKKETVDLDTLVRAAVDTAKPLFDAKRQQLRVNLPSEPIELLVDPLRISQSISNLLTNAAKYTNVEGAIELTITRSADKLSIAIADNGIGLDSCHIPQLFQMFSQVDAAIDRAEGGLGIGLALVKGFVELHGGEVRARSEGLGSGSEFVIDLPAALILPRRSPPETPPPRASDLMTERVRIVVADDNRDAADSLTILLELAGFEVSVAYSGRQALQRILDERPAAAILDIGMADLTGYEIARRARAAGRSGIFLLAVTGWGQADDIARAKDAGFDEHLTKPVDPDRVEELLRAHVVAKPNAEKPHS